MRAHRTRDLLATVLLLTAAAADAQVDPADKCEAAKLRETGKALSCLFTNAAKEALSGVENPEAATSCATKFTSKLDTAEDKADGACPTSGDSGELLHDINLMVDDIAQSLGPDRFLSNGDGTVTDVEQDLLWQQQTAGTGSPSSADEVRDAADILAWLGTLNGSAAVPGLGGSSSWGLPTLAQLQSILDCTESPCSLVDPILGPDPTPSGTGTTILLSGEVGTLPVSMLPCVKTIRLEDGSVDCLDVSSAAGYSRARVMRNSR